MIRDSVASALVRLAAFLRRRGWAIVALGVVAYALSIVDLGASIRALSSAGPSTVAVLLAVFAVSASVDAVAWRFIAGSVGARLSFARAVQMRIGIEAVSLAAPGGTLTADVSGPFLLRALTGIRLPDAASIVLLRKWGILAGHAVLLASAVLLGGSFLDDASESIGGGVDLRLVLAGVALLFAGAAMVSRELLRRGPAERLGAAVARIPWERARRFAARRAAGLVRADANTSAFFDAGDRRGAKLASLSFARWAIECFEGFFVLTLLGASPRIGDAAVMKAVLSVARTVIFFLPAGLGVRELGNIALVSVIPGGTAEIAVAYVLLRRAFEVACALAWVAVASYTERHARRRRPPAGELR